MIKLSYFFKIFNNLGIKFMIRMIAFIRCLFLLFFTFILQGFCYGLLVYEWFIVIQKKIS